MEAVLARWEALKICPTEGSVTIPQMTQMTQFLQEHKEIKTILEIGFNGGLSAYTFLSARDDIKVVSIDIGDHDYVMKAKRGIAEHFPMRHTLLIGDSRDVVKQVKDLFKIDFDYIFVDGSHEGTVPEEDLRNCLDIAKPYTWIVVDDVCKAYGQNVVPPIHKLINEFKLVLFTGFEAGDRGWAYFKKITAKINA